ncbi:hypothetical protein WG922_21935, partial [Ramlibacter sp. AN1015]|uniref:hypothetical protein n=1 Tax=Ramlibacter sp. AN1015 TaxID=3133428 RepID=UPI0030BA5018
MNATTGTFVGELYSNTTDNKLYRWTGSAWTSATAAVNAADIQGQLQAAQLAAIEAAKITGQLTASQLAAIEAS